MGRVLLAVGLAGTLLAGCSGGESGEAIPKPTTVRAETVLPECDAVSPDQWGPLPSGLNPGPVATALNVDVEAVIDGSFGGALCEPGMTMDQIDQGTAIFMVRGIGSRCLAIGIWQAEPPQRGVEYNSLMAVCADNLSTT